MIKIVHYDLFIYHNIMKPLDIDDYLNQCLYSKNWASISDEIYIDLGETEWFNELMVFDKNIAQCNFLIKKLNISDEHEEDLKLFDIDTINIFNQLNEKIKKLRLKDDMCVYISDYGSVYIIKNIN